MKVGIYMSVCKISQRIFFFLEESWMGMGETGMCFLASDMDLAKGSDRGEMRRELGQWGTE